MQVNMLRLFELAPASRSVPNSSEQEERISRFVDEHFERLKEEVGVMTEAQRSWARKHVDDLQQLSPNNKIKELAQILQRAPEPLTPTQNITEVRRAFDRALLVEGLNRWVADPNATGNKEEARYRILVTFDQQMRHLSLVQLGLNTIPPEIGLLSQLEGLYLTSNQFTALPVEVVQLTKLQVLNLGFNQLTALPPQIGLLSQLQKLISHDNRLVSLPAEVGQLSQLQELSLNCNELTALPADIGQLALLQTLNLAGNRLTALPSEVGELALLQTLNLAGNRLAALPADVGQLAQLQTLLLAGNRLTALPVEIGRLSQLRYLTFNNNPELAELPPSLGSLREITTLSNEGTQIPQRVVDEILSSARALRDQEQHIDLP
ncbi:MAG: leucine-rich repeat domain-containing protein [Chlamydiia bacterium]|nr:leucine-rich repeat domain-containing protein [Chlamydiia bacterium]